MRACYVSSGLALALLAFGSTDVPAQMYLGSYQPNPFTGSYVTRQRMNPYTGTGFPTPQVNPYTGGLTGQGRTHANTMINPYTGQTMAVPTVYNPLTGKHQPGLTIATPTARQVYAWPKGRFPVTGHAGPGFESLDSLIQSIMTHHGIPGAALAIAKDGKLVYAKGFGWSDLSTPVNVVPQTIFALASVSKPLTALAIMLLVERGLLKLEDHPFAILRGLRPLPGSRVDPRLYKITVRQMLNHTGGWDRMKSGDPTNFSPVIARALNVPLPLTDEQFITYVMTQPLDFEPGTQAQYSNIGYVVLGKVIEQVSGERYDDFVRKNVLQPSGMRTVFTDLRERPYRAGEARRYLAGTSMMLPPLDLPMVKAAGGWNASVVDMVRLLIAVDGSRGKPLIKPETLRTILTPPPPPLQVKIGIGYPGLGFPDVFPRPKGIAYGQSGAFQGMRTYIRHNERGVVWALLFNVAMQPDAIDGQRIQRAMQEVRARVEGMTAYPNIDLFSKYP